MLSLPERCAEYVSKIDELILPLFNLTFVDLLDLLYKDIETHIGRSL